MTASLDRDGSCRPVLGAWLQARAGVVITLAVAPQCVPTPVHRGTQEGRNVVSDVGDLHPQTLEGSDQLC